MMLSLVQVSVSAILFLPEHFFHTMMTARNVCGTILDASNRSVDGTVLRHQNVCYG